jgi:wyosine [tRNA(Phe)-imidazoG37] synthetase (radical SAM superfamily)
MRDRNDSILFGPVFSRRLGISLGVDMVPAKTCNLNCVYCECGPTPVPTSERKEYVSAQAITAELETYLSSSPVLDYVTFGGSGEPTLSTALQPCVEFVKSRFPRYRTALLTNGTLFHFPEVRRAVRDFDLILPSLDAVSPPVFRRVNRPGPGTEIGPIVGGLTALAREFPGEIHLEIFVVPGVNDGIREIALFKEVIGRISPARVQLNALDRPGACSWVEPASPARLKKIADLLAPLPVEIISRAALPADLPRPGSNALLSLLRRRPCTAEEIAALSHLGAAAAAAAVESLVKQGAVRAETVSGRIFYTGA